MIVAGPEVVGRFHCSGLSTGSTLYVALRFEPVGNWVTLRAVAGLENFVRPIADIVLRYLAPVRAFFAVWGGVVTRLRTLT